MKKDLKREDTNILGLKPIEFYADSDLVVKQLSGIRKIKKDELKVLHSDIKKLTSECNIEIRYTWIPREKNKEADRLSNVAMDKKC